MCKWEGVGGAEGWEGQRHHLRLLGSMVNYCSYLATFSFFFCSEKKIKSAGVFH